MYYNPTLFQQKLLAWFDHNGRHHLPWQIDTTPYRVWVSEIMLQQTQVKTVIAYFNRFMQTFPTLQALADSPEENVIAHWAGLGYYRRAYHLHQTARLIHHAYTDQWPDTQVGLEALPGIGRSTAGAILSIAFQKQAAILDGNVKRILTRLHTIERSPHMPISSYRKQLWACATHYTPTQRCGDYAQAMMDLGATVCTPKQPNCHNCPLCNQCRAYQTNTVHRYPTSQTKKKHPTHAMTLLLLCRHDTDGHLRIFLEKRPPLRIWGGLWSPPCYDANLTLPPALPFTLPPGKTRIWPSFKHSFTHKHWLITPHQRWAPPDHPDNLDAHALSWYPIEDALKKGLPAPIKRVLQQLNAVRLS